MGGYNMLNKIEQAIKELEKSEEKINIEALIDEAYREAQEQLQQYCDGDGICYLVESYIDSKLNKLRSDLDKKVIVLRHKENMAKITEELSNDNLGLANYNTILKIIKNMSYDEIAYKDDFTHALLRVCTSFIFNDKEQAKAEANTINRLWKIILEDPEEGYF